MDISVGAEYVIASALIALSQVGVDHISFGTLSDLGWRIQQRCNEKGVEAIILRSGTDIKAAVYDFSDYFKYENSDEPVIQIKNGVSVDDLRVRFMCCLPKSINSVIIDQAERLSHTF